VKVVIALALISAATCALAGTVKVDINSMPRVLFTGDSQTCGRVGAWDYPQMLSWEMPIRIINTGVGGTNTDHLLIDRGGGSAEVKAGEMVVKGTEVGWASGPYPGQTIRLGEQEYTIDHIEVVDHRAHLHNIWITEPAREDFSGSEYAIEAGWRVRVAEPQPDYACFMYTVNDAPKTSEAFIANIEELISRCAEIEAQPILLSGFPMMVADRGGSHPSNNVKASLRAVELAGIAEQHNVPYGDVFNTLMELDEQSTSVWRDTVHPTSDGSITAMKALRQIMAGLGLASNPYYVRAARQGQTPGTGPYPHRYDGLTPISISQPDFSAAGALNKTEFDRAAVHSRDEYGLLAAEDGECVEAERGLHVWFGVGELERIERVTVRVVVTGADRMKYFDKRTSTWQSLVGGDGELTATLEGEMLANAWQDGEIGLWIAGPEKVAVDYVSATIEGDVAAWEPVRSAEPIVWPPAGDLVWEDGGLIANGSISEGDTAAPTGWEKRGEGAVWVREEVVAEGTGGFEGRTFFLAGDGDLAASVRPLDMITIADGPEGCAGKFLISVLREDGAVQMRRRVPEEAQGLAFTVTRSSGCAAVPGGCNVQASGASYWQTVVRADEAGRYRLGFFYRVYDPVSMQPKGGPGEIAEVQVGIGPASTLAATGPLECSYQWQRGWLEFALPAAGELSIQARALSETAVEFTGFSLTKI